MSLDILVFVDLVVGKEIVLLWDDEIWQCFIFIGEYEYVAGFFGFCFIDFNVNEYWLEVGFDFDFCCVNLCGGVQGGMICVMLDEVMFLFVVVVECFMIGVFIFEFKISFMVFLLFG